MTILQSTRDLVRYRANFACEYCEVTETDTGAILTIDHFRPSSHAGGDDEGNLVYCCHRCNEHKGDYWPQADETPSLWNPRVDHREQHFTLLADGILFGTTGTGDFTAQRLRLNRPALVALRLRRLRDRDYNRLLTRLQDVTTILEHLGLQHAALVREQQEFLEEQRQLLQALAHIRPPGKFG